MTATSQPFTPGNIVVLRIGDGSIPLDTKSYPVFLDEYTSAGGPPVRSIALPTILTGTNNIFTLNPDNRNNGFLTLSPDGKYLAASGYDAPLGTTNNNVISLGLFDRTVAIIDHNGNVNTSTKLTTTDVGTSHTYSAITSNGTDIWASYSNGGIRYCTIGATSSISIEATAGDFNRTLGISDGQLYFTGANEVVYQVGTGLPQTSGQTATALPGLAAGVIGASQFFFADLNPAIPGNDVIYITASDNIALRKYSFDGGAWVLNGVIGVSADDYTGITGVVNGTSVTLYMTRRCGGIPSGGGHLVTLTDNTGYTLTPNTFAGTPTVLAMAGNQTAFRGVALAPSSSVPSSLSITAKIYLQGAFNATLGRHKDVTGSWAGVLNTNALNQPFGAAPFNYSGTESVASGFFTSTGAVTDIVDWVLLELRDAVTPSTVVASKAAFVREDGQIVGTDGLPNLSFTGVVAGNYHLVVRHRNHLAIRTSVPVSVSTSPTLYDFTSGQAQAFQNGAISTNVAMAALGGGAFGLWAGDANGNSTTMFTGAGNDSDALLTALGNNQAAILRDVYNKADLNLDGMVRYTGLNNDAGVVVKALGGNQASVIAQHQ
jgi:hypothetical protein